VLVDSGALSDASDRAEADDRHCPHRGVKREPTTRPGGPGRNDNRRARCAGSWFVACCSGLLRSLSSERQAALGAECLRRLGESSRSLTFSARTCAVRGVA
jgi:hypothetical protein